MQTVNAQDANVNTTDNASAVELPNTISAGAAVEMIPLRSLVESPYNQRKKARTEATILEFADNIRAVGLLQNLVVHPMKKRAKKAQTYSVAAGETRRLGLLFNVERGGSLQGDFGSGRNPHQRYRERSAQATASG